VDYAFLFDAAASTGLSIRDMYVNFKPWRAFQIQAGQFKEPFSQEIGTGITNVEFLERSFVTVLYPSAAGVFRAPGIAVHGDLHNGAMQYWVGAFNGKGIIANNTTNEPDYVGRLRFSPCSRDSPLAVLSRTAAAGVSPTNSASAGPSTIPPSRSSRSSGSTAGSSVITASSCG
jgi:phosphate-selective porin